jgi:proteasome accessory factor A
MLSFIRLKIPIAQSIASPDSQPYAWFTANGGSVRLERLPILGALVEESGLVEGATPECLSAKQLHLYQRAQDAFLSQAAAASGGNECEVALVKNNTDGQGAHYSAHENYDALVAKGWGFTFWRIGLVAVLFPTALLAECLVAFIIILSAVLYFPVWMFRRQVPRLVRLWEWGTLAAISLAFRPFFFFPNLYFRLLAFRKQRQGMLAFLVTRQVFAGAGSVQKNGQLVISPRALVTHSVVSTASEVSRPVFLFGHVLKATSFLALGDTSRYRSLHQPTQRLQIALGDANMAPTAEYLKIGTTRLVLAAIEAGDLEMPPRLRWPLWALRRFSRDVDLKATAKLKGGPRLTMVEIQRLYWQACRRHVDRAEQCDADAEEVLALWARTLDDLEMDPKRLFGRVDWITKRMLLEAGDPLPVDARRKLDARYHELSREGGYIQLEAAGVAPTIVEPEDVLKAIQEPPKGTRAAIRGRLIRDNQAWDYFGSSLRIGWTQVIKGSGPDRVISLLDSPEPDPEKPSDPLDR